MKNVVKSLPGIVCLMFALSGCRMFSPTFTYTPEMQDVCRQVEAGDVCAMRRMASYCWMHPEPTGSHELACRWIARAADAGDASACELMGWCTLIGDGVSPSRMKAAQYFYRAGAAYWDRWMLTFAYPDPDPLLTLHLARAGAEPCDCWMRVEDLFLVMSNLNRAILLGSTAAAGKRDVVCLQLGRLGIYEVACSNYKKEEGDDLTSIKGGMDRENIRAGFEGRLPGLRELFTAGDNPNACTNDETLVMLARGIADKPSDLSKSVDAPLPDSVVFLGLANGCSSAGGVGWGWGSTEVCYTRAQNEQIARAYEYLEARMARELTIARLAKILPCYYDAMGKTRTLSLYSELVCAAGMTAREKEVLQSCLMGKDWPFDDE